MPQPPRIRMCLLGVSPLLPFLPSLMRWPVSLWALLTHQSLCGAQCTSPVAVPLLSLPSQQGSASWPQQTALRLSAPQGSLWFLYPDSPWQALVLRWGLLLFRAGWIWLCSPGWPQTHPTFLLVLPKCHSCIYEPPCQASNLWRSLIHFVLWLVHLGHLYCSWHSLLLIN